MPAISFMQLLAFLNQWGPNLMTYGQRRATTLGYIVHVANNSKILVVHWWLVSYGFHWYNTCTVNSYFYLHVPTVHTGSNH